MIRLHKHEAIVDAMGKAICRHVHRNGDYGMTGDDAYELPRGKEHFDAEAAAALDAMLEAVVKLEVGKEGLVLSGVETDIPVHVQALILKLEPKP